jgi:hypothetical protein
MIPETLTVVDWVPVDTMAEIIIDLVHSGADQDGPYLRIFNLLNPNSTPWSSRAGATQRWFASLPGSVHLAKVPFSAWIEALQATKMDNAEELDARPAAKILDSYIALEKAGVRPDEAKGVFDTDNGRKYSETFAKLLPIDSKLMDIWLRRWNF